MPFAKKYSTVFLCLLLALPGFTRDDTQKDADQQLYDISESFTVSAATVEVVVTENKDQRVTGLTQNDFVLTVDGRKVPINYFSEVRSSAPEVETAAHVVPVDSVPRNYLAYIDGYFTHRQFGAMLFKNLLVNVEAMRDIDRMALIHHTGTAPTLVLNWSSDRELIKQKIQEIAEITPADMRRRTFIEAGQLAEGEVMRAIPDQINMDNPDAMGSRKQGISMENSAFQEQSPDWKEGASLMAMSPYRMVSILERQVTNTAQSVELAMRGIERRDGRNMLLLVSAGWPFEFRKYLNLVHVNLPKQKDGGEWLLRPITDTANLLGYTIYPIHVGQLESGIFSGPSSPDFANFNSNIHYEVKFDSLKFLADQTGGKMLGKAQFNKQPLGDVARDNQQYYVLGFATSDMISGDRHEIKVTINNQSYKVRHRKDFRARTNEERGDQTIEQVLLTGQARSELKVSLGEPTPEKGRKVMVPMSMDIPMDWASLQKNGEKYLGNFTLRVSSEDKRGNRADLVRAPIQLAMAKPGAGAVIVYDASLLLRKKTQRLVFSLRDENSTKSLTSTYEFKP